MSDWTRWWLGIEDLPVGSEGLRFVWEHPFAGWVWLLAIVAAAGLGAWSYRRLDAPDRLRGVLAITRMVLLLVLVACISGPMLELPRERVEQ